MSTSKDLDLISIVSNIPYFYHSADLRNYFSQFIEGGGFKCFHFRHRPEKVLMGDSMSGGVGDVTENSLLKKTSYLNTNSRKSTRTTCCVIKTNKNNYGRLIKMYDNKHWLDKEGNSIPSRCRITKLKITDNEDDGICTNAPNTYQTRLEQRTIPNEREMFTSKDLAALPEMHPPIVMPNGNVGTPTMHFLKLINSCRLPSSVIKKLGLVFPKQRSQKKYGSVPFEYGSEDNADNFALEGEYQEENTLESCDTVISAHGHCITDCVPEFPTKCVTHQPNDLGTNVRTKKQVYKRKDAKMRERMELQIEEKFIAAHKQGSDTEDHDDDSCEEWERHEALYDDPSNQERNNERLFEEEMEVVWEKGGSGLVFYTDAQYWKKEEGDFDEQTADDWDVDISAYYEKGAGDKDIKDFITIRDETQLRNGSREPISCFSGNDDRLAGPGNSGIGRFEKHTRGFGRKILEKQGWKEGKGLGSMQKGIADALEGDGQHPKDKKGLGYREPGKHAVQYRRKNNEQNFLISTIYDNPAKTDPPEKLLRRHEPYHIKHRNSQPYFHKESNLG